MAYGMLLRNGTSEEYYYYIFNVQGDVIGILDSTGTKVVEYTYNAWGEILSVTGTSADTIGQKNPLRYRGYYYDSETGLYYLQSRYYDSETYRFINADGYASTGQGVLGNNMFAYCGNNPINRADPSGNFWGIAIGVAVISGIASLLSGCASKFQGTPTTSSAIPEPLPQMKPSQSLAPINQPADPLPAIVTSYNKTQEEKKAFVDAVYARGVADEAKTGIPAALMTAQACLESAYGSSSLAVKRNNLFGFVGFTFDSIDEAIITYQNTLTQNPRYSHLLGQDLITWVNGIGPAGYCPEGDYAGKLWAIIGYWDLK